jgi:hypothetical protein
MPELITTLLILVSVGIITVAACLFDMLRKP